MDQKRTIAPAAPDHQLPPAETEPGHSKKKWWIWAIAIILVGLILYLMFRPSGSQTSQSTTGAAAGGRRAFTGPVTITTATAAKGDIGVYLDAIGTVTALYTDSITAQVTGVIQTVHYKEGELVRKGDAL